MENDPHAAYYPRFDHAPIRKDTFLDNVSFRVCVHIRSQSMSVSRVKINRALYSDETGEILVFNHLNGIWSYRTFGPAQENSIKAWQAFPGIF